MSSIQSAWEYLLSTPGASTDDSIFNNKLTMGDFRREYLLNGTTFPAAKIEHCHTEGFKLVVPDDKPSDVPGTAVEDMW